MKPFSLGFRPSFPVMHRVGIALGLVIASSLFFPGCGKKDLAIRDSDAFQSASPEVKGQWQAAVGAAKTNGYYVAYSTLEKLRAQPGLGPEQSKAVEELLGVVGTRMFNAANNGDPEATKAMKEIQGASKRR